MSPPPPFLPTFSRPRSSTKQKKKTVERREKAGDWEREEEDEDNTKKKKKKNKNKKNKKTISEAVKQKLLEHLDRNRRKKADEGDERVPTPPAPAPPPMPQDGFRARPESEGGTRKSLQKKKTKKVTVVPVREDLSRAALDESQLELQLARAASVAAVEEGKRELKRKWQALEEYRRWLLETPSTTTDE